MTPLLVIGRPGDLIDAEHNGFVVRSRLLLNSLGQSCDLSYLLLRTIGDNSEVRPDVLANVIGEISLPALANGRAARLRRLASRRPELAPWESEMVRVIESGPWRRCLTLGPWLTSEYRAACRTLPTVLLADEDLQRMPDNAPQSRLAKMLRGCERLVERGEPGQPESVIVVGEGERRSFGWRYPRSKVVVIPWSLDPAQWPVATDPSTGHTVLVVGNLAEPRHADSLTAILGELSSRGRPDIRVELISHTGLAPSLETCVDRGLAARVSDGGDLYAAYRSARLALVPADRATGVKTTILQGWATGCPVVAHAASAATVRGRRHALRYGNSAAEIVDEVIAVFDDEPLRHRLAAAGRAALARHTDLAGQLAVFRSVVGGGVG